MRRFSTRAPLGTSHVSLTGWCPHMSLLSLRHSVPRLEQRMRPSPSPWSPWSPAQKTLKSLGTKPPRDSQKVKTHGLSSPFCVSRGAGCVREQAPPPWAAPPWKQASSAQGRSRPLRSRLRAKAGRRQPMEEKIMYCDITCRKPHAVLSHLSAGNGDLGILRPCPGSVRLEFWRSAPG